MLGVVDLAISGNFWIIDTAVTIWNIAKLYQTSFESYINSYAKSKKFMSSKYCFDSFTYFQDMLTFQHHLIFVDHDNNNLIGT